MIKSAVALACLFAAGTLAVAADAATFTFSFTAPWQNVLFDGDDISFVNTGDTGRGSGIITTGDADADGAYTITNVTGTWTFYDGGPTRTIDGYDGGFGGDLGLITPTSTGGYTLSNIGLYDEADGDFVSFATLDQDGTAYAAFSGEVLATEATFTVTPQAADSAVPEPASWAMMVGGFGLIGAAMRRRKTAIHFARSAVSK